MSKKAKTIKQFYWAIEVEVKDKHERPLAFLHKNALYFTFGLKSPAPVLFTTKKLAKDAIIISGKTKVREQIKFVKEYEPDKVKIIKVHVSVVK